MSVLTALPPANPVLARELKQRMRGRHVWLVVTLYLTVLAVILRWVYVASSRDQFDGGFDLLASATAGRAIFQWLLFFMLLLVCFIVPGLTAGAISGERERQTMVALQLTLLRPRSIVVGKLLASLAFVVLLIIASLPLVTVPFLVGGVSLSEVVKGLLMVIATAVTLACLTLACSAVFRRTQAATVVAYGITLALVLGTLLVYGAQQVPRRGVGPRPDPWVLAVNPFAATADVVKGRRESLGFASPFAPLHELLELGEGDRLSDVVSGSGQGESIEIGPMGPIGPDGVVRPPMVGPAITRGAPGGPGFPGGPGGPGGPGFSQSFAQAESTGEAAGGVRLGGVRFWVLSLWTWFVLAVAAVAVTVRRISLPATRESP
jgi:ABC-2 type transport system permease protein